MKVKKALSQRLFRMPPRAYRFLVLFIFLILFHIHDALACSTFMLKKGTALIVGHNLEDENHSPGVVVINKRGVHKLGKSWSELAYNQAVPNPPLTWISKYGSVTFNTFCRDFPDGGMNEAGLFITEMSLADTRFPQDSSKPLLFMMLWMQYVLDNFNSVEQVVRSAHVLTIDGWNWHFFTADRKGNAAVIEFLDRKTVVYQGEKLPVPVLCNEKYKQEMEMLQTYRGFGGEKPVVLKEAYRIDERFVRAARMINDFDPAQKAALDYGFEILTELSSRVTQWSYVCDLNNLKVYFKTTASPKIKELNLHSFDLSCQTPVKMLDIHADFSGSIERNLRDYSLEYNRERMRMKLSEKGWEEVFTSHGSTPEEAIANFSRYSESTKCKVK